MEPKDLLQIPTMAAFYELRDSLNLTDRQKEVFFLKYSRGWRNVDIAAELEIHQDTVGEETRIIRKKLAAIAKENLDTKEMI